MRRNLMYIQISIFFARVGALVEYLLLSQLTSDSCLHALQLTSYRNLLYYTVSHLIV